MSSPYEFNINDDNWRELSVASIGTAARDLRCTECGNMIRRLGWMYERYDERMHPGCAIKLGLLRVKGT